MGFTKKKSRSKKATTKCYKYNFVGGGISGRRCDFCGKEALHHCAKCYEFYKKEGQTDSSGKLIYYGPSYCSGECQKSHWKDVHKSVCLKVNARDIEDRIKRASVAAYKKIRDTYRTTHVDEFIYLFKYSRTWSKMTDVERQLFGPRLKRYIESTEERLDDNEYFNKIFALYELEMEIEVAFSSEIVAEFKNQSLYHASVNGDIEEVKYLLTKEADVNYVYKDPHYAGSFTSLYAVSTKGYVEIAELLLEKGANVNFVSKIDDKSVTALIIASAAGHTDFVKLLLEKGADPNFKDETTYGAIVLAALLGQTEIVKLLMENGVATPLIDVFESGVRRGGRDLEETDKLNIMDLMLKNGADANEVGEGNVRILSMAIITGDIEMIKLLLKHGAKKSEGLAVASQTGRSEIVKLLLENGADVNLPDESEISPLFFAIGSGNKETVKLLLQNGADVNVKNRDGLNALDFASTYKSGKPGDLHLNTDPHIRKEIVNLLKKHIKKKIKGKRK